MTQTAVVPIATPNPTVANRLLSVHEVLGYQRENCGRIPFGRDALYAIAHRRLVSVVLAGRKVLFLPSSIDLLLSGTVHL